LGAAHGAQCAEAAAYSLDHVFLIAYALPSLPDKMPFPMAADITVTAEAVRPIRRMIPSFGLSWRVLGMVVIAIMTAELLLFLPSIARYRLVYLEQLIESGTLAALALDATPDNMVTDEVKRQLLNNARVDAVVLVEPNKPKRALLNIAPRPDMPTFNLKERGSLGLIWDALATMTRDGAYYTRVGGESMRLPHAMVWIVVDELPMRIAMYGYSGRVAALSIIIALFTAALLYLALRWLVVRPLQGLAADMTAFRRAPEELRTERAHTLRNDEIGVVDREFQNLQHEIRTSLRQKTRLAEVGAASNKINHDLRNMLSTARLLSDRLALSDDERTRKLAPTILNTIDRATRLASEAIEYVRDRPMPKFEEFDLADLVAEAGVALQEQGEDKDPNQLRDWRNEVGGECRITADRDLLYRVFVNLGRNAFDAGANLVTVAARVNGAHLSIDVIDNGPGVPPAVARQLFRPFTTGGRASGAGLGLAIARDLVRAHGGDIALIESNEHGTTFRFTLPL
jgi:signal transduction histidine kinase